MYYNQPDFYRFSQDSIILSKLLSEQLRKQAPTPCHLLDVGCGCGVIGLEVLRHIHSNREHSLILLERQYEFLPYIKKNRAQLHTRNSKVEILNQDFLDFKSEGPITHIISNPPYFLSERGRASPNNLKQNCRSWGLESACKFLERLREACQFHQAHGYICGREELQVLLDQLQISYKLLQVKQNTFFYLLC